MCLYNDFGQTDLLPGYSREILTPETAVRLTFQTGRQHLHSGTSARGGGKGGGKTSLPLS